MFLSLKCQKDYDRILMSNVPKSSNLRIYLCRGIYEIYCPIWQVSLVIRSDLQDTSARASGSSPLSAAGKALSRCSRHGADRQIDGVGGKCYKNSHSAVSSMSSMSWAHYSGPFFPRCSFLSSWPSSSLIIL